MLSWMSTLLNANLQKGNTLMEETNFVLWPRWMMAAAATSPRHLSQHPGRLATRRHSFAGGGLIPSTWKRRGTGRWPWALWKSGRKSRTWTAPSHPSPPARDQRRSKRADRASAGAMLQRAGMAATSPSCSEGEVGEGPGTKKRPGGTSLGNTVWAQRSTY